MAVSRSFTSKIIFRPHTHIGPITLPKVIDNKGHRQCLLLLLSSAFKDYETQFLFCLQWEAFSLPELESFLLILHKEEETYVQEIRETHHVLRIQMQKRLKQLRQDRVGPGARLKPAVA